MKLDEFESVFRSAAKETYRFSEPEVEVGLLVTDLGEAEAEALLGQLDEDLSALTGFSRIGWQVIGRAGQGEGLLERVEAVGPGLIVAHRALFEPHLDLRFGLGTVLETLTQACEAPVLALPREGTSGAVRRLGRVQRVMVVTPHITGHRRLVDWGLHLTPPDGTIYLVHVEDEAVFERYIDVIGRIPGLDTDVARDRLAAKLVQMPEDYMGAVVAEMKKRGIGESLVPVVRMGHPLREYEALVAEHAVDLVVVDSHDRGQLAMDGRAHALAVQLRDLPIVLL